MSNFLDNLLARSNDVVGGVRPRPVARFEAPAAFGATAPTPPEGTATVAPVAAVAGSPQQPTLSPELPTASQSALPAQPAEPYPTERAHPPRAVESLPPAAAEPVSIPLSVLSSSHAVEPALQPAGVQPPMITPKSPESTKSVTSVSHDVETQPNVDGDTTLRPLIERPLRDRAILYNTSAGEMVEEPNTPPVPLPRPEPNLVEPAAPPTVVSLAPPTAEPPRSAQETAHFQQVDRAPRVNVTIGRIEVYVDGPSRAAPRTGRSSRSVSAPKGPALSLDEYLARRNGERR